MCILKPPAGLIPLGNFEKACASGLPDPDPTEIIHPGRGRQITQYNIKWFVSVNFLSFSAHQINMYLSSYTQTIPNFSPKAGPKIWTILGKNG